MTRVLLCSSDRILIKGLYGLLRDEGYSVDIVDRAAAAVRKIMFETFHLAIVDDDPFGMPLADAVTAIRSVAPDLPVILLGEGIERAGLPAVQRPVDLEIFTRAVHRFAV